MRLSTVTKSTIVLLPLALLACGGFAVEPTLDKRAKENSNTEGVPARVTRVVDGDTIDVTFLDGRADTVRLLAVDTPETFSANKPDEYANITDTACLDHWGDLATAFALELLDGEMVDLIPDPSAGARGSFGRLLAYKVDEYRLQALETRNEFWDPFVLEGLPEILI